MHAPLVRCGRCAGQLVQELDPAPLQETQDESQATHEEPLA